MSEKLWIDWAAYLTDINRLVEKVRISGVGATCVYGVEVSGLIPATVLSCQLDLVFLSPQRMISELRSSVSQILVIDSVVGSGEALLQFQPYKDRCTIAALYKRKCPTVLYPDIQIHEVEEGRVVLPFERDVSAPAKMPTSSRGD